MACFVRYTLHESDYSRNQNAKRRGKENMWTFREIERFIMLPCSLFNTTVTNLVVNKLSFRITGPFRAANARGHDFTHDFPHLCAGIRRLISGASNLPEPFDVLVVNLFVVCMDSTGRCQKARRCRIQFSSCVKMS